MHLEQRLWFACRWGDLDAVRTILLHEPNVNWRNPDSHHQTALFVAHSWGMWQVVRYLLTLPHLDPDLPDSRGRSPLLMNVHSTKSYELLVRDPRVDVNRADRDGITPLLSACLSGSSLKVKLLLLNPHRLVDTMARGSSQTPAEHLRRLGIHRHLADAVLDPYRTHPRKVVKELAQELRWSSYAAQLLCLLCLLGDQFVAITPSLPGKTPPSDAVID